MVYSKHHIEKGVYREISNVIHAFQYDGNFVDEDGMWYVPDWAISAYSSGVLYFEGPFLIVDTPEGKVYVDNGDFIIKNKYGLIYPCKPDAFYSMYEKVGKNG